MLIEFIIESYENFSRKVHKIPDFTFEPSDRELKQVENFVSLLENKYHKSSLGRTFLFNFFAFSYNYWSSLDHKGKKRIPLNWIIGKKALTRWTCRGNDDLYFCHHYVSSVGIHIGQIKAGQKKDVNDVSSIHPHQELEKDRFHNTGRGLKNCIDHTTLYNHKSVSCIRCKFRKDCKQMLKDNYPKIYTARGYMKIK